MRHAQSGNGALRNRGAVFRVRTESICKAGYCMVDGRKFSGYDFGTGGQFLGTVDGRTASVFDHQDSSISTLSESFLEW